jgi:hypothetical protein
LLIYQAKAAPFDPDIFKNDDTFKNLPFDFWPLFKDELEAKNLVKYSPYLSEKFFFHTDARNRLKREKIVRISRLKSYASLR